MSIEFVLINALSFIILLNASSAPRLLAYDALALAAAFEPLVKTGRVETVAARLAFQIG